MPCETWDNATITGHVDDKAGGFPLVLKTWRIAPGHSNTWSIRVLGTRKSAYFSSQNPRQWQFMEYSGGTQVWQVEDLGYQSLFPAITGGIFEFGFADAIQHRFFNPANFDQGGRPAPPVPESNQGSDHEL